MGTEAVATCGGAGGQWRMAVRPPASTHSPRGTDLSPSHASSTLGVQWRWREPRTAGFFGASACARGPGTAGPTWRRAGDVVRRSAGCTDSFRLTFFQIDFLQKFKQECSKL
jgi:hypothetical protein